MINRLSLDEVKRELGSRGIAVTGNRTQLVARLEAVLLDEYQREAGAEIGAAPPSSSVALSLDTMLSLGEALEDADLRVAVVCGGPSEERGISLNSARSVLDHLQSARRGDRHCTPGAQPPLQAIHDGTEPPLGGIDVVPYYLDQGLRPFVVSHAQLYSNTPSDFDYKLQQQQKGIGGGAEMALGDLDGLIRHVATHADVVIPSIHGRFGEDGGLQELLEKHNLPFVGTGSAAARVAFHKAKCADRMADLGFPILESVALTSGDLPAAEKGLRQWLSDREEDPASRRLVVKPASSGSSIGVRMVKGAAEAARVASEILASGQDETVVIEPFVEAPGAVEFSCVVIETDAGPVALLPSEIEVRDQEEDFKLAEMELEAFASLRSQGGGEASWEQIRAALRERQLDDRIYSYRRKYLPTSQVFVHTPPRMPLRAVQMIRLAATRLFKDLGLRDFARIDGWVFLGDSAEDYVIFPDTPKQERPAVSAATGLTASSSDPEDLEALARRMDAAADAKLAAANFGSLEHLTDGWAKYTGRIGEDELRRQFRGESRREDATVSKRGLSFLGPRSPHLCGPLPRTPHHTR